MTYRPPADRILAPSQTWSDWFWSGAYLPPDHEAMAAAAYEERRPARREAQLAWNRLCDDMLGGKFKQEVPDA